MEYLFVASGNVYGDLCYARILSKIYDYLIKTNWINKSTKVWDGTCTLEEKFGDDWEYHVRSMDFDTFNATFNPTFVIRAKNVPTMSIKSAIL